VQTELPYKLLIGPLFNPRFLGKYQADPQIKLFMPRSLYTQLYDYDVVYDWENLHNFDQILAQLPLNWKPDLVIWWDLLYQGIPPGIEDCPYPTALIPGDWNLGYLSSLHFAEIFDLILADIHLKQRLEEQNLKHAVHWPGFSFDPEELYLQSETSRIYDITFIGNLNEAIHPQRSQILDQVLSLRENYQIFVRQGVWGEEYRQVLNQSKIVLNYTIAQVMNMRGYEAPACGALLFIEAENLEISHFLQDKQECVYYRADNLLELLTYYLEHDEERQRIARAGHRRIQTFSYENQFAKLLEHLPEWLQIAKSQQKHRLISKTHTNRDKILALSQFFCSQPETHQSALPLITKTLEQIQEEANPNQSTLWELNALACLLYPLSTVPAGDSTLQLVKRCFEQALQLTPENPVFHYHLALCLEMGQETYPALVHYSRCVELLASGTGDELFAYRQFILPFFRSRGRNLLAIEWERASFEQQNDLNQLKVSYIRLLMCHIWQRLGQLLEKEGNLEKAQTAYQNAVSNFPNTTIYIDLARISVRQGRENQAWDYFQTGLKQQPFLISQLGKFITPHLFLEHLRAIQAGCERYQDVFAEVSPFINLCQLINLIQTANIGLAEIQSHLAQESPWVLHWLKKLLENGWKQPFKALDKLRLSSHVYWEAAPEAGLKFKQITDFTPVDSSALAEISIQLKPSEKQVYLRSYTEPTNLSKNIIGVDTWPLQYPQQFKQDNLALELKEWLENTPIIYFVLADTLSEYEKTNLLEIFEKEFGSQPETGLLLWSVQASGPLYLLCENKIENANVSILDHELSCDEFSEVLKHITCLISNPYDNGLFYSTWALWLGVPIWITQLPAITPWPGQAIWQLEEWVESNGLNGFTKHNLAKRSSQAKKTAQRIQVCYQEQAENEVHTLLWQMRLQVPGLLA
jgi:tetratricopeptide (TPR) repeat protein